MLKIQTGIKNDILRTISEEVKLSEFNTYLLIGKQMLKYIKNPDNGGIGLAAPQIGYNKRIIVVSLLKDRDDENFQTILMFNPKILSKSLECEKENEGCLSLPGENGKVERYQKIKLSYIDETKKERVIILSGLSARVVQHEIDHLDGILFLDRVN